MKLKDSEDPFLLLSEIERIATELRAHRELMGESTINSLFLGTLSKAYGIEVGLLERSASYSRSKLEQRIRDHYNRRFGNPKSAMNHFTL